MHLFHSFLYYQRYLGNVSLNMKEVNLKKKVYRLFSNFFYRK